MVNFSPWYSSKEFLPFSLNFKAIIFVDKSGISNSSVLLRVTPCLFDSFVN